MTETDASRTPHTDAQKGTTSAENPAVVALQSFASDLDDAAALIAKGEFSQNGLGSAGNAFRALQNSSDAHLDEAFSELLHFGTRLFEAEHLEEAKNLLVSARIGLAVPHIFQERLDALISGIEDVIIMSKAEKEFYHGDESTAFALAEKLKSPKRTELLANMRDEALRRKKTRRIAFGVGGIAITAALAMTAWGATQAIGTFKNPPKITLEPFELPQQHRELIQRASEGIADAASRLEATSDLVATEISARIAEEANATNNNGEKATEQPVAVDPGAIDPNTLYSCALAHGVLKKLSEIEIPEKNRTAVDSIKSKYVEVCAKLGLSEAQLDLLANEISNTEIDDIVAGLTQP